MESFTTFEGLVTPLDRANVDTDAIIPKQYLKSVSRTGFGPHLFDDWRYLDPGYLGIDCSTRKLDESFVLNDAKYADASILLARDNFGCGSSREHAVWALLQDGYRVVISPRFADIFHNNCFRNGLLPVTLPTETVEALFAEEAAAAGEYRLKVDLPSQTVTKPDGTELSFEIDPFRKERLLEGLDDVGATLKEHESTIRDYEQRRRAEEPWAILE